jgi:TetR/AcrR family transcriptional regulator, tetracycline repressor protein
VAVSRDGIVAAGLALLDEAGLEGLTLRRLADRLGIRAPTLYWHVRDKRELLDLMVSVIMDEALADWREPHPGQPWWDWLAGRARALRAGLLAHRDGALMLAGNRPAQPALPGIERQLAALAQAGFAPPEALLTLLALNAYVIGEALDTQGESGRSDQAAEPEAGPAEADQRPGRTPAGFGEDFPLISAAVGGLEAFGSSDQRFEHGLALMITGLRAQHDPGRAGPTAAGPGAAEAGAAEAGAAEAGAAEAGAAGG